MTTTTATSRMPAFHAADRVVLAIVAICASPAWSARVASAPELRTRSLTSTPCATYSPFSTATNCGTWFMLLTVAIVTRAGPCPEAACTAPRRRQSHAAAATRIRCAVTRRIRPPCRRGIRSLCSRSGLGHPGLLHEDRSGVVLARAAAVREDQFGRLGLAQILEPVDHPRRDEHELVLRDDVLLALGAHVQFQRPLANEERRLARMVVRLVPALGRDLWPAHRDRRRPNAVLVDAERDDQRGLVRDVLVHFL